MRGTPPAADPQIVALWLVGVYRGAWWAAAADKERQTEKSDRCAVRSHKAAALLTMSNSCACVGPVKPGMMTAGNETPSIRALTAPNPIHDARKCRSIDGVCFEG